jgi:hypothetical protein
MDKPMLDSSMGIESAVDSLQVFGVAILVVLKDGPGNEVRRLDQPGRT